MQDHVFHRDFRKQYPIIERADGVWLHDTDGKRYLDASSGAIAVNLGHGVKEIVQAMADQAAQAAFVHTLRFETQVLHELAREIVGMCPPGLERVYFTSGGSEANESALKLARQHHRDQGKADKHIAIGRWQSYHGNTLGALAVGGDIKRRKAYASMLPPTAHVHSPFCARCPFGLTYEACQRDGLGCVKSLEQLILEVGPENISAFICEPIVGSQQGAVVPPKEYLPLVRDLCNRYDIVMIVDEVMTGFGRSGENFAIEHFGVTPDILTFGKGVSSGYAPLGGMVVHHKMVDSLIEHGEGRMIHGYTYSGHPVSVAAGLAAVRYYQENKVLDNCRRQGDYLMQQLQQLKGEFRTIGDIHGRGLLIGLELVSDRTNGQMFPPGSGAAERLNAIAMERGAVFYPGSGAVDGFRGEHLLIGPPLSIQREEVDYLVRVLRESFTYFETQSQRQTKEGVKA